MFCSASLCAPKSRFPELVAADRQAFRTSRSAAAPLPRKERSGPVSTWPAGARSSTCPASPVSRSGGPRDRRRWRAGRLAAKSALYLLGSARGALLHQRGLLPLHANAVVLAGRAIAFCGHSGAGKSTIAAWFHDRGDPILADDICAVDGAATGEIIAYPGVPRLRLWRDALEKGGREASGYRRSFDSLDKWDVPIGPPSPPVPLAKSMYSPTAAATEGPVIRSSPA